MGRVVVSEFISLDGVVEAPGGEPGYKHTGWVFKFQDAGMLKYKLDEIQAAEALLLGRKTYEGFAEAWPERDNSPDVMGVFAKKMNSMPKFVASTTLTNPSWNNTTILDGETASAVRRLKEDVAGELLLHGSGTFANFLRLHDLVDEYRLMTFPIVLGSGSRLFEHSENTTPLKLVSTQAFESGIVVLTYEPVR